MPSTKFYKYGTLYSALVANGDRSIEYVMINTFLTLEGARPACIVRLSDESYAVFKQVFDEKSIGIVLYNDLSYINSSIKHKNYLIISPFTHYSLIGNTLPIIRRGVSDKNYHIATGKLLGYMKPMNIKSARGGRGAQINVELDGEKLEGIIPQRVGDATDEEILEYYKKPLGLLEDAYKNPSKYDYFPLKFLSPPVLVIKRLSSGGKRRTIKRSKKRN